ncbi:MAG: hypothetical protein AAF938_23340 [Myxococcota bacterium]
MRTSFSIPLLLALGACGADAGAKGVEDDIPADGKADSFRSPTEHGDVRFDVPQTATLRDDERFHAFEFALEGDADIRIDITSSNVNLDTVAYLYRRETTDESWGRYIERNDDAEDGRLTSSIGGSYGAGLYRIIVKGFKIQHTGPFDLLVGCSGACGEPERFEIPRATGFGEGCASKIDFLFSGSLFSQTDFTVDMTANNPLERFGGNDRVALELYTGFAGEYISPDYGIEEMYVSKQILEDGEILAVDIGADEDTIYYVFSDEDGLLFSYWSNQSPEVYYYCNDEAARDGEPDLDCVSTLLYNGPHDGDELGDLSGVIHRGSEDSEMDPRLRAAGEQYFLLLEEIEEDTDEAIELTGFAWDLGAQILVDGVAGQASYYVVFEDGWTSSDRVWVVSESYENSDGTKMLCEQHIF